MTGFNIDKLHESSGHIDKFIIDNLPPPEDQPDFLLDGLDCDIPARLNIAERLLDRWIAEGKGKNIAIISENGNWTYDRLFITANKIAQTLTGDLGLVSGNRVLLYAPNNPMLVACWLGIVKAGGVVVTVPPLLRVRDLLPIVEKAEITITLCDERLISEAEQVKEQSAHLTTVEAFNGTGLATNDNAFDHLVAAKSGEFDAADVAANDPVLLGFTSGTTGNPKATVHYHRDIALMSASYVDNILKPTSADIFIGSPPLGFTFGLGGLVTFPFHVGASVVLVENGTPSNLAAAIAEHNATICFTAPTAYRAILALEEKPTLPSLRHCISAGEHLPPSVWEEWHERFGVAILNLLGATEMFHSFICMPINNIKPGAVGLPAPGYEACIFDDDFNPITNGEPGYLGVRGPTGCRYLNDERQKKYVRGGWNMTGDIFYRDSGGFYWFVARSDEMIISSGYNISGVEVESVLIEHPSVKEVAVVGVPDQERGQLVTAFIRLNDGYSTSNEIAFDLKNFVKQIIAPYKYPRSIKFVNELPKTATGKVQRNRLATEAPVEPGG